MLRDDLHGEFPGRHKYERRNSGSIQLRQPLHDGEKEGKRFAGACLRRGDDVLAFQRLRNCRRLHGSGRGKSFAAMSRSFKEGDRVDSEKLAILLSCWREGGEHTANSR